MSLNFQLFRNIRQTIFIVEDDVAVDAYYETLLQSSGADVRKFRTGKDFCRFYSETKIKS
jgi:FixJ family two-component response regulator